MTMLQAYLPPDLRAFRDAFAFAFVILSCSSAGRPRAPSAPSWSACEGAPMDLSRTASLPPLLAAARAVRGGEGDVASTLLGSEELQLTLTEMLIRLMVVVGIYVFVGNSGVISFGHIGFMCIGAYAAAWATLDPGWKQVMLTGLPEFLQSAQWPFRPTSS